MTLMPLLPIRKLPEITSIGQVKFDINIFKYCPEVKFIGEKFLADDLIPMLIMTCEVIPGNDLNASPTNQKTARSNLDWTS